MVGSDVKYYLARTSEGGWAYLYLTTNINLAVDFTLDSQHRLTYNDPGFSELVTPTWDNTMTQQNSMWHVVSKTPSYIASPNNHYSAAYEWKVDGATSDLTVIGGGSFLAFGTYYMLTTHEVGQQHYLIHGPLPHPGGFGPAVSKLVAELF
jgi:hypothetical protein